jgi:hypothetical protein
MPKRTCEKKLLEGALPFSYCKCVDAEANLPVLDLKGVKPSVHAGFE